MGRPNIMLGIHISYRVTGCPPRQARMLKLRDIGPEAVVRNVHRRAYERFAAVTRILAQASAQ
jgi:hypothetical protein